MEENIGDTGFYVRMKQIEEENFSLREEAVKLDNKCLFLERTNACLKRQLQEGSKKYNELRQEYDMLMIELSEVMTKEKMSRGALTRSTIEKQNLIKKLEAAELEVEQIASLKEALNKAMKERSESMKEVIELIKMLEEKQTNFELLQGTVKELEEKYKCFQNICESRDNTIQVLRETNRELADENEELKLLLGNNVRFFTDRGSTTPNSDTESFYMHDTSNYECNNVVNQGSLYNELKAVGFMNTYDSDVAKNLQLEDKVHWYEVETDTLLKQTERAFEQLVSIYGEERFRLCVTKDLDYTECFENTQHFEILKQRIQILLDTFTTPSKIADIVTQLRADSGAKENLHEALNSHDHLRDALDAGNGSISPLTINQNPHGATASVQSDILHADENVSLQIGPTIAQSFLQRLAMGREDSKRTNEAMLEEDLTLHDNVEFTNVNVNAHGGMILGYRRSKSESSLITENKLTSLHHRSFNVFTMSLSPEKTSETVEAREKIISDSTSKERERNYCEETKEQNGLQNLTSWHEYKFGSTYRSLNDSKDSSICSTPSRHNSRLGSGDFSLNESCQRQRQREFCPFYLAPTRLKLSSNKTPFFPKESGVNANSTPIHTDSKDKHSFMYKKDIRQSSSKNMRRSSCGSLIRQFVDLDLSDDSSDSFSIHDECNLDKINCNKYVQNVISTDGSSEASVSNESLSYRSNSLKRNIHVFPNHENPKECCTSDEMQFSVTTVKETKDCIYAIQENIHETSLDYEDNVNGFEKSVHENLPNIEELKDILEGMKNSLEENNNALKGNDFYTTGSMKSNDFLNDVSQNCKEKLTDSSKRVITSTEQKLSVVSHAPIKSILIMPSWRVFISYALVFIVGYYLKDVISLRSTSTGAPCTWYSFEEILNRYFSIRSKKLGPL